MTVSQSRPLVYLISDGSITNENYRDRSAKLLSVVAVAADAKIPLIQIREKRLSGRGLYELVVAVMKLARPSMTRVLVNDRMDVAIAAGADGVHLPSNSVPVEVVRHFAPEKFLIGVSAHSTAEIAKARSAGADFAVLGPVYASPGKGKPIGLEELHSAVSNYPEFPILGLGGIDETNYRDVLERGAAGFAAMRFLNNISNIENLGSVLDL